ncbi:MAG: hypothetical protein IT374_18710 [Polyangiaceae bacterium]|nr:hypothetical protein [Polyangiaceae bacterium]
MTYPCDGALDPDDPDTLAFLGAFRRHGPSAMPSDRMTALIAAEMPGDLKAWLHTYSLHPSLVAIGDLWFEAGNCQRLADVVEAFESPDQPLQRRGVEGLELESAIVMGNTADGEVFYEAAWKPGDARLTMVKFCAAGYADDGYRGLGRLVSALRDFAANLEDPDEMEDDEALRALLLES